MTCCFSWFASPLNHWTTLHLIYFSFWIFYKSSNIPKSPRAILYHLFQNRCHSNFLSSPFISKPISKCVPSSIVVFTSMQHWASVLLAFYKHSALHDIVGCIVIYKMLFLCLRYVLLNTTDNTWSPPHLYPTHLNLLIYNSLYNPVNVMSFTPVTYTMWLIVWYNIKFSLLC